MPVIDIGGLAALGQLTFFAIIGIVILALVVSSIFLILTLFCTGSCNVDYFRRFMLTGGTAHLRVCTKIIDKYSTTEMDDRFTSKKYVPLGIKLFSSFH